MINDNRLGIPTIMQSEGVHGWLDVNATMFPSAIGMGCSFNPDLVREMANVVGTEANSIGVHNIFGMLLYDSTFIWIAVCIAAKQTSNS